MAHALAHPFQLVETLYTSALIQRYRREWQTVRAYTEAMLALATEHGFARHVALGTLFRGMVLAGQVVRGRIDAVYEEQTADGESGFLVVDWKTSRSPTADPCGNRGSVMAGSRLTGPGW